MIAVIFEVTPLTGKRQAYFNLATEMRPLLDGIDGFISIERFQSLADPRRILSLSFWRKRILETYRLRVAGVLRDYGMHDRAEAPEDSRVAHGDAAYCPTARSRQSVDLVAT